MDCLIYDYARVFVREASAIKKVKAVIEEMDDCVPELLPVDLVTVFEPARHEYVKGVACFTVGLRYMNLKAIDLNELAFKCWTKGIDMFYMVGDHDTAFISEKGVLVEG